MKGYCIVGIVSSTSRDLDWCYEHILMPKNRRMRANVRGHYRVITVRQEDYSSTASASQLDFERGDCGDTCMDAKMSYARRVGEEEAPVKNGCSEV
jgi:hypothetical protein